MYSFRGNNKSSQEIALVNIDEQTLSHYGQWPWNRDRIADLVAAVGSGQPKTILLDLYFDPDVRQDTAGYTAVLAGQMSWTKNVILPYEISRGDYRTSKISIPKHLYSSSIQVNSDLGVLDENATLIAQKAFLPPEELCQYSAGLGFKYSVYDGDRKIRWEPLAVYYDGYYYPSASLIAAAHYLGIQSSSIRLYGGEYLTVGSKKIPINKMSQVFINFNKPGQTFPQISAADILSEKYDVKNLSGKLVIISVSAELASDYYNTPVSPHLSSAEKTANVIENIIHSNHIKRLDSSPGVDMLILFALGGIFAFILPRISLLYRLVSLVVSIFILANVNFILFNATSILARPLYIALELFLLALASPILDEEFLSRFSLGRGDDLPKKKPERIRKTQGSGKMPKISPTQIPKAVEQKTETAAISPIDEKMPAPMTAMLDNAHESDRTAAAIPREETPDFKSPKRVIENSSAENILPAPLRELTESGGIGLSGTPSLGVDGQIKNLGRYKIVAELGKGAMGMVYKGIDPAINRYVALKTIRLDFVHDPEEMAELKERLYREARAAGKLSHPNIVTIYDVGNEGALQYIAMEYLEGQTLENMIRRKVKFNFRIIAQIITQICGALDYAHAQGIVHRDIKPANIMVLNDYSAKVMDFGIARVDSSSMTRTGIAMGTPNYISPEQLQGKPVDHRADIFSMGIVMYEMLVGRRPFRGENLTSLIYNIVNTEPEAPSSINKSIPFIFDRVIAKALKKNPEERFQKAGDIVVGLSDFIETFSPKKSTMA
jgi:serine/threonine-protein kinase